MSHHFPCTYPSGREIITVNPHLLYRQNYTRWDICVRSLGHACACSHNRLRHSISPVDNFLQIFSHCTAQSAKFEVG